MENNFDKFFKEKLEHREYEMKPEYWAEAEALIEANEKSGNWRRFFMWFGVVLTAGLVLFFVWKNDDSNDLTAQEKTPTTKLENVISESKNTSQSTSAILKRDKTDEPNKIAEQNNKVDDEVKKVDVNVLLQNDGISTNQNLKTKKQSKSSTLNSTNSKTNQPDFSKTIPNSDDGISNGNNLNPSFLQKNNQSKSELGSAISKSNDDKKDEGVNLVLPNKSSSNSTEEKVKENVVKPIASNTAILLPFLEMFLSQNQKIEELDLKPVCPFSPPRNKFAFGIFGGAVGYPLIENSSDQPFIGFKTGIFAEHNFEISKAKMAVGAELIYHYRSGNFEDTKQNEVASYSFGRSVAQAKLTPENLHYVELPIYLKYQKKRMTFETGASINYLLGVKGKVIETDGTEQSGWVPSIGFKKNHVNVLLGFHYRLSDNLHFGVRANYTPGGILDKDAVLPDGITVALQESKPLYLTFRVTQYFNFKK